jgi:hypothetical protein
MSYIGSKRSSSLVSFDEGTIGSGVVFPAGHVIQVEYDNDDQAQNTTAGFEDYLQINITPKKSGNLIFITATIATYHTSLGTVVTARLVRDGTNLNYEIADFYHPSGGGVAGNISVTFIDAPTIPSTPVSINYAIQIKHEAGSGSTNKDYNGTLNGVSSLVAMEIQQ